jgi:hypothetical protein
MAGIHSLALRNPCGQGGEPLKTSSVFIYNSIEEAQIAAAASATSGDELPPMVFLPSNGYEVRLKPDGTPEEAQDQEPDEEDLEDEPLSFAPVAGKVAPPQESDTGRLRADEEEESLAELTSAELLRPANQRGLKVSLPKQCTCNGTSEANARCAVHGRFR